MNRSQTTKLYSLLLLALSLLTIQASSAASKQEIDARVQETLERFFQQTPAGRTLSQKAAGMLIFPNVIKAGIGIGGEYGEGVLQIGQQTVDYYATASASIGFQLGAQAKSQVILFMDKQALDKFRRSEGWKVGVDGSVAIANFGTGAEFDSNTLQQPVIGFIFGNKGLMYDLSLEGSKFTKIKR